MQVNTHIMEVRDSQISCENCYFGSKMSEGLRRGGAEIVSALLIKSVGAPACTSFVRSHIAQLLTLDVCCVESRTQT